MNLAAQVHRLERQLDQRRRWREQQFYPDVRTELESPLDAQIRSTLARMRALASNAVESTPVHGPLRDYFEQVLPHLAEPEREQMTEYLRQLDDLAAQRGAAEQQESSP